MLPNNFSQIHKSDFKCSAGGDFYICYGAWFQFIGCCTSDPCADGLGICPDGHLRPAHRVWTADSHFPYSLDCMSQSAGVAMLTCKSNYSFFGCCEDFNTLYKLKCDVDDLYAWRCAENKTALTMLSSNLSSGNDVLNYSRIPEPTPLVFATSAAHHRSGSSLARVTGICVGGILLALLVLGMLWRFWYALLDEKVIFSFYLSG